MKRALTLSLLLLALGKASHAQSPANVGIGTTTPHPSAILHASSSSQGFLLPTMCSTQRLAIPNPAPGLLVFDSCDNVLYYFSANINIGPWISLPPPGSGGNTLDQSYDEGGLGAGRIITVDAGAVEMNASNGFNALEISNGIATGVDIEISSFGTGMRVDAEDGTGVEVKMHDNGTGVRVETDATTTGRGVKVDINGTGSAMFATSHDDDAENTVHSRMLGNYAGGSWFSPGGRSGYFSSEHTSNIRPAIEARAAGPAHGAMGITGAFTSTADTLTLAGVAGGSFSVPGFRNGVSGFSISGNGVWGKEVTTANNWTADPSTFKSGVYGTGSFGNGITGGSTVLFQGVTGNVTSGYGVLGTNEGHGHGVIGVTKGGATGSQAGVWGMARDGDWATHTADYLFADNIHNKGLVGVLGQAKNATGIWAESQSKIGLVATTGAKMPLIAMPVTEAALVAMSSQPTATTAYIANAGGPALPALKIVSSTVMGGMPGAYAVDVTGTGTGGGITLLTSAASTMPSLNVTNSGTGPAARFHKSSLTSIAPTLLATTSGLGRPGEFDIPDNDMNTVEALLAKTSGKGSAASFVIADATSMSPVVNVSGSGLGNAGKFLSSNPVSTSAVLHAEAAAGKIAYFKSSLDTSSGIGVDVEHAGVGTAMKIENTHAMPAAPLGASTTAFVVESKLGPVAHFDAKHTLTSAPSALPVVLISSSSTGQMGLKVTTTSSMISDAKAAEFNGEVDITKKLTMGGDIVVGSGSSATVIEDDKIKVGELRAGSIALNGVPVLTIFGSTHVAGSLTKAGGTFKIDHPLDPLNKYLYHSFVESPDMMNIYNGNIVTDDKGFATVMLPSYFDALNKDFRYQLTCIGTFAQAIVSKKIVDNHFVIQTDKPGVEVSWMVTGVRNDDWARENRVVPEVEKEEAKKGTLLYRQADQ